MGALILLTERQQQVLELLNQGFGQPQIAGKLWLAYDTVRSHTSKIRDYFDAHSNREAVKRARAWGFVGPEGSPVGSGEIWRVAS
jgi:DNA-binding NarL/FixJ family response regulator